MHKIPTLFERQGKFVIPRLNPKAKWVLEEYSIPRRQFDGTCMLFEDGNWFYRRSVRLGRDYPFDFVLCERDEFTFKAFGWQPVDYGFSYYSYFLEALEQRPLDCDYQDHRNSVYEPGTYELVGPKVNGNPEGTKTHRLMPHNRAEVLNNVAMIGLHELSVEDAYKQLAIALAYVLVEGAVFYGADNKMAKIKRSDFPYADI